MARNCAGSKKKESPPETTTSVTAGVREMYSNMGSQYFRSGRRRGTINLDWETLSSKKEQSNPGPKGPENPFDTGFFDITNKNKSGKDEILRMVTGQDNPEVQAAEDLALQTWRALECYDVGRVDIRYGANGKPYVLELNPLSGMRPRWSGLAETARHHGISHEELIGMVLDSALERYPHLKERNQESKHK